MSQSVIRMTYRIETSGDVAALATKIASDQSTGTFVPTPGETPELKARVGARVVEVRKLESVPTPSFPETNPSRARPLFAWRGGHRVSARGHRNGPRRADDDRHRRRVLDQGIQRHPRRRHEAAAGIREAHPGPQFGIAGSRALTGVNRAAHHRHDRQTRARPAPA